MDLDATHDPGLKSWVESANEPGCEFPIQNLPFGVFSTKGTKPRAGVAIGDQVLDLAALGLKIGPTLNGLAAMGRPAWRRIRKALSSGLSVKKPNKHFKKWLVPLSRVKLHLPLAVGDYTDFFTGIHHATNMGRLFRPDNPLLPNYKWVPIGYHGRSSSLVVSGTAVKRPRGQVKGEADPAFMPSRRLDYEAELGFVVGPGNRLGEPVPVARALDHVFGVVLLNDWSARDIQAWEYQPLGPFLAKSFATTLSPWVVTLEALAPYRCPPYERGPEDPKPLPYLSHEGDHGYDIQVEMHLRTPKMKSPQRLSRASFRHSYWTVAQMVAHHTSNGCNLRPGDLLGSGTISGPTPDSFGSLMELTQAGRNPLALSSGETRSFLEDGDEVIERGYCAREGYATIGFGDCSGRIAA